MSADIAGVDLLTGGWVRVYLRGHPHAYAVRVATGVGGPRVCDLRIERLDPDRADLVTRDVLRAVPIGLLARAAAEALALNLPSALRPPPAKPPQRRQGALSDEHYGEVARLALAASAARQPVARTIAERFGTSVPTADRYLRGARERGLLPPDLRQAKPDQPITRTPRGKQQ